MDKKILLQIEDEQRRLDISKIIDTVNLASRHYEAKFTHFLDPATIYFIQNKMHFDDSLNVSFWGGYEGAERQILCVAPEWAEISTSDFPIKCIKAQRSEFDSFTHRDFLGSLMGLGIERSQIGDIVVLEDGACFFVKSDMAAYVTENLLKVGRGGVKLSEIGDASEIAQKKDEKQLKVTVASLRLDSVLSAALNISRTASADLIKSGRVKVNFEQCENLSKLLCCGDLISVRGFGRLKVSEIGGKTRKGRIFVFINRYL